MCPIFRFIDFWFFHLSLSRSLLQDAQITEKCIIEAEHHRAVMGQRGRNVQQIVSDFDVQIKFPERQANAAESPQDPDVANTILVTGKKEDVERACEQLLVSTSSMRTVCQLTSFLSCTFSALLCSFLFGVLTLVFCASYFQRLVPIKVDVPVPFDYHRFIIGKKGSGVRRLMDEFQVQIQIPPQEESADHITVIGTTDNVQGCKEALQKEVDKLDEERVDRVSQGSIFKQAPYSVTLLAVFNGPAIDLY